MKNFQTKSVVSKIIKAFIVLIVFTGILFIFKDEFKVSETDNYGNSEEYEYITLTNDKTVTQFMKVKHNILLDIVFNIDFKEIQEGTLNIQLFDSDGHKIQSFDYDLSSLSNYNSIDYPLLTKLKAGNTYSIVFNVNGAAEGEGPHLWYTIDNESENHLKISDNRYFGEINSSYNYVYYNMNLVGLYAFIVILIAAFQFIPPVFSKKLQGKIKYISIFVSILMPAAAFLMFETITQNLFSITSGHAALYNILIFYCFYFLVMAITNRTRFTIVFLNSFLFLMACMEYFIQLFRGAPIMPADLYSINTALSVANQYNFTPNATIIVTFAVLILINMLVTKLPYRIKKFKVRLGYIIFAVAFNGIIFNGMLNSEWPAKHDLTPDFWALSDSYAQNGFMLSSVIQLNYLNVEKPEKYALSLASETKDIKKFDSHRENTEETIVPDNIIVIMNESWADLSVIGDFNTSSEISLFINELNKNTIKGNLYVSTFGGGTANTEYEVLTGNTMAFLPPGSVPYQIYVKEGDESLASLMSASGYKTIAFHPESETNWNRNKVYPYLGFDEFFTIADFTGDRIRGFASDYSDFDKVISLYEQKEAGEKLFIFNVTMQNHGGYGVEFDNTVSLTDYPGKFPEAEQYLSLLQLTDSAFEYLVDYFSDIEENTMILMYGDHQPAIEGEFYEQLFGKKLSDLTAEEMQKRYITPMVLWTNYDMEEKYLDGISANYLSTLLIDQAGLEMPYYNRFLSELYESIPVINAFGYYDTQRCYHNWSDVSDLDSLLYRYHNLQYNNVFDKKNRLQNCFNIERQTI